MTRRTIRLAWRSVALIWSLLAGSASRARACSTCGSGDPTLTAAGTEQPFAGRQRYSLELTHRTDSVGTPGLDRLEIRELRATLTVAHAVSERLLGMLSLPLVYRRVDDASLAVHSQFGPGDLEARGKFFVYRDREFQPRWLLAMQFGAKFPTAPFRKGTADRPWPLEAQSGTGSWDLLVGPALAGFAYPFSYYASAQLIQPVITRSEVQPGRSLRTTLAAQYQLGKHLALRAVNDTRHDARTREGTTLDSNSGGSVSYAGADILVSPQASWSVLLGARAPWLQRMHGAHEEGPLLTLALTFDR